MKSGIYLGPPVGRGRRLAAALVWLAVGATVLHVAVYVRQLTELGRLRADVERREQAIVEAPLAIEPNARAVLARLRAASVSGVANSIAATEILQIVAGALPGQVALVGLSIEPSGPRPSLVIDAIARREEDVTALERRMAASDRVAATRLLGERTDADGSLVVRLQVDLKP